MRILTRQVIAQEAPQKWAREYSHMASHSQSMITKELASLTKPINPDDVDRIVGNTSWTYLQHCSSCKENPDVIVEVGEAPDYDSATAWLCPSCLRKAVSLIEGL